MDFNSNARGKPSNPYRGIMWAGLLAAALLIVIYGMSALAPKENGSAVPEELGAAEKTSAPARARRAVVAATLERPPQPQGKKKEPPAYLSDPRYLKEEASSAALDTFSFYYLLYQVSIADAAKLAAEALTAPGAEKMTGWKPGAPASLEGTIIAMEDRVDLGIPDVDIASATEYRMEDARGNPYLVFAARRMRGVGPGDDVKVVGRYLRLYADPETAKEKKDKTILTPVILVREVDGSRYLKDPSCLKQVRDGALGHEAKPFFHLAYRVVQLDQAALKAQADPTLTPDKLGRLPEAARGKAVAIDGNIIMPPQLVDETPNIAGTGPLYWTILRTRSGPPVWVYALEESKGFQKGDAVRVYGLFFKSRTYRDRTALERTALLVLARRLTPLKHKESNALAVVTVAIGAVVVTLLVIAVVLERRTGRKFGQHVQSVALKSRPKDINAAAKQAAARARGGKGTTADAPEDGVG